MSRRPSLAICVCVHCGKQFEYHAYPSRKPRRYCSLACLRSNTDREYVCATCGKPFTKHHFPSRKEPRFCSDKCSHIGTPNTEFICKGCGKPFQVRMFPSIKREPKYCSYECSARDNAKPTAVCKVCGKHFTSSSHHKKYAKFCSVECRSKSQYKYPDDLLNEVLKLFQEKGARRAAKELNVPEWYVRAYASRMGVKPNPSFRYQHFRDNSSQLELDCYKYLDELGIAYIKQHTIGHFVVDAFIEPNIVLEADGDYWHGHPRFEPLTERQRRQQSRDKARNTYFANRGYIVIRIWECDMSKDSLMKALGITTMTP